MQNQSLPSPLPYFRIPQRIALSDSWCCRLVRITTWRRSSFCGLPSPKSLWSVGEKEEEINARDFAETVSERCVACLWQRRAHPFSFIDDGACPWQPVVISYVVWKDVSFQCVFLSWCPEQASLEFVKEAHVVDSAIETKTGLFVNGGLSKSLVNCFLWHEGSSV